jgi:hypothetical protein
VESTSDGLHRKSQKPYSTIVNETGSPANSERPPRNALAAMVVTLLVLALVSAHANWLHARRATIETVVVTSIAP